jgi:outer membrane protein TolC
LAEVQEALISAQNQLQLAWAVLENVSGAPIETRELPESIPAAPWSDHVDELESAIAAATSQRAEIGALSNQRQAAAEGVLIAEADKRVGVDVVADYDVYTGDFRRAGDSFFAGVVIQLNLFDGGRTRAEVARAAAQVRELEARERRLMLDIELDVRSAYLQLRDAEARLEVATKAIEQGRESLREIEVRYRGQAATITELIDAQVALSNARVRRTSAEAEVEIARAALQRAMGRLDELVGQ